MKTICKLILLVFPFVVNAQDPAKTSSQPHWQIITATGIPEKREDCSFVEVNGLFYLLGGRGIKPVDVFNPVTNTWQRKGNDPMEIHHFQAVAYKNKIYILGGMTGVFPHEKPLENIYIYNTATDEWQKGPEMPAGRLRGSGGTVVYDNKIYLICGIQDGHYTGTVAWMDEFDPETGKWRTMPDAPHSRDHGHAVLIGNQLYMASGRVTSMKTKQIMQLTIPEVDVFDFKKQEWRTLPASANIPTVRGGATAVKYKNKLVVIGGETIEQQESHHDVEAYDTKTGAWAKWAPLVTGRHDTQAITYKGKIYIAAGSAKQGGGPDQSTIEVLEP